MTKTHLVIIHNGVRTKDYLTTCFKDHCIVKHYKKKMTTEEVLENVVKEDLTHIAFVYHYPGYCSLPFFKDKWTRQERRDGTDTPEYFHFSNKVINMLREITNAAVINNPLTKITVDLLSCSLTKSDFAHEVSQVESDLEINIRYSLDKTGNAPYGNWLMESDGVNIKDEYFTDAVDGWDVVLTGAIPIPEDISGIELDASGNYIMTGNVIWADEGLAADDFIDLSAGLTFNGKGFTIDMSGISFCEGLFACSDTSGNPSIIKNLGVLNGQTESGAFIVKDNQQFFSVISCYSTGEMGESSAGIVGRNAGMAGVCTISGCYSTGDQTFEDSGGICYNQAGFNGGHCTITNCYSTGEIAGDSAGICNGSTARNGGTCIIDNCYSTGKINDLGYGICGNNAGHTGGLCIINNCYSNGEIGFGSAGIGGFNAGNFGGICKISNCYAAGNIALLGGIGDSAGGICADSPGLNNGVCTITNCYTVGNIGAYSSGITGSAAGNGGHCTITNCYALGDISLNAGGICGENAGRNGECIITNCYSTGTIDPSGGGICGPGTGAVGGICTVTNCYSSRTDTTYDPSSNTIDVSNGIDVVDGYAIPSTDMLLNSLYDTTSSTNSGISPFISISSTLLPVLRGNLYVDINDASLATVDISDTDNGGVFANTILNLINTSEFFDNSMENVSVAGYTTFDPSLGFFVELNDVLYPIPDLDRVTNNIFILFGVYGSDAAPDSTGEYISVQPNNVPETVIDDIVYDPSEIILFNKDTTVDVTNLIGETNENDIAIFVPLSTPGDSFTFVDDTVSVEITNAGDGTFRLNGTTYNTGDTIVLNGKTYKFGSFYGPIDEPSAQITIGPGKVSSLGSLFQYRRSYLELNIQKKHVSYDFIHLKNKMIKGSRRQ